MIRVFVGVWKEVEDYIPDYSLIDEIDFQIIHTSRGCTRRCGCCGVYQIEPEFEYKNSIKKEVIKKNIVFYDNNLLANPYIGDILRELYELKKERKLSYCESQSGFDGRILLENPNIAEMLKKANFKYPKIAWDGSYCESESIKKQIDILIDAGYKAKDISVFILYNSDYDFSEMENKRVKCWEWNVQISDCRYRPLDQIFDKYSGLKKKSN